MTISAHTVLIIDDTALDRQLYQRYLLANPDRTYHFLEAASVAVGLELYRSQRIDVVLLDYLLPEANGLDFLIALKTESNAAQPPVVMVTGHGDESIATKAIKLGAEDYLVKSNLTPHRLQTTLNNAIASAALRRELAWPNEQLKVSIDTMLDCFGTYSAIRNASGQIIDFRFDYLNAAALESNQMTVADMAKGLCEVFPALRGTVLFEQYCQVVETGTPLIRDDIVYTGAFGTRQLTKAYEARINKLNDGFVAAWRDVTVQRQREEERDRFFDLSLDLLAIANFEGHFVRLNPAWEATLGFTPAELMAQPYLDFIHPDDRENTMGVAADLSMGETLISFENRYRCKDGSYRWLLWNAIPDIDRSLLYTAAHDITDRKRQEAALLQNERKFSAIFNQTFQLMGLVSLDGTLLDVNQAALDSVGVRASEIVGKSFWDAPWWHTAPLQQQLQAAIATAANGQFVRYEVQFPSSNGEIMITDFSLKPMFDEAGKVEAIVAEANNITDRKQAQADLEQRNRELDSFVHIVSHDLKAPLRAVANLSQWIEDDLEGSLTPATQTQMTLLRTRVDRMSATIDGLLDYARVGRTPDTIESVSVAELLAQTIDSLGPPSTFKIIISSPLPILQANRLLLSQVFANLISNSIKHHDRPDGEINIGCQECSDSYRFEITDDGPGIAPENHDKIFTIFQAVNPQNSQDSTGIGLSIVKKIIETVGGTIQLESAIGQGATFSFTWPK